MDKKMRRCFEKPSNFGGYSCGGGVTIDGVRYCSEHAIKMQIDYAGHTFCADLEKENKKTKSSKEKRD